MTRTFPLLSILFLGLVAGCDGGIFRSSLDDEFVLPNGEEFEVPGDTVEEDNEAPTPPTPIGPPVDNPTPPAASFDVGVDHKFFPLAPGRFWIFEGTKNDQARRDELNVLKETVLIDGVVCTAVRQHVFLDETLVEISTEWYAQDLDGNVWKFGEESLELEDGVFQVSADSWTANQPEARAWLLMSAEPAVGDVYEGFRGDGEDIFIISQVGVTATGPLGTYADCAEAVENPEDLEDSDTIIYAPELGMVSEANPDGRIDLVQVGINE